MPAARSTATAWPYEATGIGAYDGVFHDHGEADHLWYVTNDAVVFCGNLAVTEAGSSRDEYYWNIYNLLGDPSLATYMGVPAANPVTIRRPSSWASPAMTVTADVRQLRRPDPGRRAGGRRHRRRRRQPGRRLRPDPDARRAR